MAREIRIVERVASKGRAPAGKGFYRRVCYVVECAEGQEGHPGEPGVKRLWFTDHFNGRAYGPRSKREAMLKEAEAFAEHARRAFEVGLSADTPAGVVADLRAEWGLKD